jgi:hypothetical protein
MQMSPNLVRSTLTASITHEGRSQVQDLLPSGLRVCISRWVVRICYFLSGADGRLVAYDPAPHTPVTHHGLVEPTVAGSTLNPRRLSSWRNDTVTNGSSRSNNVEIGHLGAPGRQKKDAVEYRENFPVQRSMRGEVEAEV